MGISEGWVEKGSEQGNEAWGKGGGAGMTTALGIHTTHRHLRITVGKGCRHMYGMTTMLGIHTTHWHLRITTGKWCRLCMG